MLDVQIHQFVAAVVIISILILGLIFVVVPIIFSKSKDFQRNAVFLSFITYPKKLNYSDPSGVGLYGTRNFNISVKDDNEALQGKDGVHIGVWHVLPRFMVKHFVEQLLIDENKYDDLRKIVAINHVQLAKVEPMLKSAFPVVNESNEKAFYENLLKVDGTIVIYLHGNTGGRGSGHRVDICRILRNLDYHVFTMDYRSFADSDPVQPTEEGVVRDAMAVFEYVRSITSSPIIIWGHSLGTGVATRMVYELQNLNTSAPRAVILESPFTSLNDEIRAHPMGRLFRKLPWFNACIAEPLYRNNLRFESHIYITGFSQPVLILHAEDDYIVPFELGYELYRIALDERKTSWGPVQFHRFAGLRHYGHKFICRAPELPQLVRNFVDTYRNELY